MTNELFDKPFNGLLKTIQALWKNGQINAGQYKRLLNELHKSKHTDHLVNVSFMIACIVGGYDE